LTSRSPLKLLEDAIPEHLQVPRMLGLHCKAGFTPKTVSICPRFKPNVTELVKIVFGVQFESISPLSKSHIAHIIDNLIASEGPQHFDRSTLVDALGYQNVLISAYWRSRTDYEAWQRNRAPDWWYSGLVSTPDIGVFCETFVIDVRNTETTFSHPNPAGYGHLADSWSDPTDKHEYFGSARDRLPVSQSDSLEVDGRAQVANFSADGKFLEIVPYDNMCLLRSGQNWQNSPPAEFIAYEKRLKPSLEIAMRDLDVNGEAQGCEFNRYATMLAGETTLTNNTFSFSAWRSLAHLEKWTEKSPEHLEIFAKGIQHYKTFPEARLELWHEMYVLPANAQKYAYYNCNGRTGMLNACDLSLNQNRTDRDIPSGI
jgi:aldoxime dehydratase